MPLQIFVDLDGVLVDFVGKAIKYCGLNCKEVLDNWPEGEYDLAKAIGVPPYLFYSKINCRNFWSSLEWLPHGKQLLKHCKGIDKGTTILTTPLQGYASSHGKLDWAETHKINNRTGIIIHANKHRLSGPDHVLIDDSDENCEKWAKRGGTAILFPQVWNSAGRSIPEKDKLDHVLEQLRVAEQRSNT